MAIEVTAALISLGTAVVVSLITSLVAPILRERFSEKDRLSAIGRQRRFHELYEPLYKHFNSGAPVAFAEMGADEFRDTLIGAVRILEGHIELAPQEAADRLFAMKEAIAWSEEEHLDREVRWLYDHVEVTFRRLQNELRLA